MPNSYRTPRRTGARQVRLSAAGDLSRDGPASQPEGQSQRGQAQLQDNKRAEPGDGYRPESSSSSRSTLFPPPPAPPPAAGAAAVAGRAPAPPLLELLSVSEPEPEPEPEELEEPSSSVSSSSSESLLEDACGGRREDTPRVGGGARPFGCGHTAQAGQTYQPITTTSHILRMQI